MNPGKAMEMEHWILESKEIAFILAKEKIKPQPGSPFLRMERTDEDLKSPSVQNWPSLIESLTVIAKPESVLGLISYPPEDPQFSWFYSNSSHKNLAQHKQKFDGTEHMIVWPLHPNHVRDDFLLPLNLAMPITSAGTVLNLDRDTLVSMAAIVDIMQENSLIAFLNRSDPPECSFLASDLLACFYRSLQGADLRWMAPRAKLMSPVNLAPVIEDIEKGLAALERKKLIHKEGDRYRLSTELAVVCARLSECSGFSSLSLRKKLSGSSTKKRWHYQHIAAAMGLESLWLYEFSDITQDNFILELRDCSPTILQKNLQSLLPVEDKRSIPSPPPTKSLRPSEGDQKRPAKRKKTDRKSLKYCSKCGTKLRPGASFCPGCGSRLISKGSGK